MNYIFRSKSNLLEIQFFIEYVICLSIEHHRDGKLKVTKREKYSLKFS